MPNITEIDIIILSYAFDQNLLQMTSDCISSLMASEHPGHVKFNTVVIESKKELAPFQYPDSITIYPDSPFGYHHYMNIGISATCSQYICLCNNDIIFHPNWASEILKSFIHFPELMSASPISVNYHKNLGIDFNTGVRFGYRVGYEIAGWCLFMKRDIFSIIGSLDENYKFTGADYDYAYTLWLCNIRHALITASCVDHHTRKTLSTQNEDRQNEMTNENAYHFKKWKYRMYISGLYENDAMS